MICVCHFYLISPFLNPQSEKIQMTERTSTNGEPPNHNGIDNKGFQDVDEDSSSPTTHRRNHTGFTDIELADDEGDNDDRIYKEIEEKNSEQGIQDKFWAVGTNVHGQGIDGFSS